MEIPQSSSGGVHEKAPEETVRLLDKEDQMHEQVKSCAVDEPRRTSLWASVR